MDDYYAGTEGKTGAALRSALHGIVKKQSKVNFSALKDRACHPIL